MTDHTDSEYVMVPRVPTEAMREAAWPKINMRLMEGQDDALDFAWTAMLAAAPPAPVNLTERNGFVPCPTCHQYSHSIGDPSDLRTAADLHFNAMYDHRGDGVPTQYKFDDETRDLVQRLIGAGVIGAGVEAMREACARVADAHAAMSIEEIGSGWDVAEMIAEEIRALTPPAPEPLADQAGADKHNEPSLTDKATANPQKTVVSGAQLVRDQAGERLREALEKIAHVGPNGIDALNGKSCRAIARAALADHPPAAPAMESVAQRQAREVMNPAGASIAAQAGGKTFAAFSTRPAVPDHIADAGKKVSADARAGAGRAVDPPDWATAAHDDIEPDVEVRKNTDGTIDEVLWSRIDSFHLEQMDDGQYWIGLTRTIDGERQIQHIMLTRHKSRIYPTVYR